MKLSDVSDSIAEIVSRASQSVITIFTRKVAIGEFLNPVSVTGAGSGFIIDERGYAVTNYHVVEAAEELMALLPGGSTARVSVVAGDRSRDLALVRVEAHSRLPPLRLGDSDKVRVGELVFAIGSPLGLPGPTVTMGIVSAVGRTVADQGRGVYLEDLIQTDAAINPGNSGGPLINADGEAVGVTTAIIPYAQGVGFAIPINSVRRFIALLERFGRPVTVFIGVYVVPVTPELAAYYRLGVGSGLLVARVVPGSPAEDAGLEEGDVIVEANGRPLSRVSELRGAIEDSVDKGAVTLTLVRRGSRVKVEVPVAVAEA